MPDLLSVSEPAYGRITIDTEGDHRVLRMSGEIDLGLIDAFQSQQPAATAQAVEAEVITVVDLAEVTFLSSAGLTFLIRQTQPSRQAGRLPILRGAARPAHQVMAITGVTRLFDTGARSGVA